MWLQDRETVRGMLGETVVVPIVKYVVPVLLLTVTGIRIVGSVDVAAWRRLPGGGSIGGLFGTELTLILVGLVAIGGWMIRRYLPRRRNRRRE